MAKQEIIDSEQRIFEAILLTDMVDQNGVYIPVNEEKTLQALDQIMMRGGVLHDYHTNKVVGRLLQFDRLAQQHPIYPGTKCIKGRGQIYRISASDDEVWKKIQEGEYEGISFGGRLNQDGQLEGYEFALCKKSANPPNMITAVSVAQSDIQQPFADYKDFDECVSKNSDKEDPEAYCGYIKHKVEEALEEVEMVEVEQGMFFPSKKSKSKKRYFFPKKQSDSAPARRAEQGGTMGDEKEKPPAPEKGGEEPKPAEKPEEVPEEPEKEEARQSVKQEEPPEEKPPEAPAEKPAGPDKLDTIISMLDRLLALLAPVAQTKKDTSATPPQTAQSPRPPMPDSGWPRAIQVTP